MAKQTEKSEKPVNRRKSPMRDFTAKMHKAGFSDPILFLQAQIDDLTKETASMLKLKNPPKNPERK